MSDTIIQVKKLGKKYIIHHQKKDRYIALRDVLAEKVKGLGWRLVRPSSVGNDKPKKEEFWALKDVSFEIKRGEVVGVIGRNGAGKSTLLKLLSRITEPTTGRIHLKGRVGSLLEVGTGFHPELTGRENIFLNGAILGMGKGEIKQKFDEIVAFAEIDKFLDTPVKRYSSGMHVRLAFAVAAHLEPEILLVDEVLAVGDAAFQKKCMGKMGDVAKEGRTILFVSHNMGAISRLCKTAFMLEQGALADRGRTDQVVQQYFAGGTTEKDSVNFHVELGKPAQILGIRLSNEKGAGTRVFDIDRPNFLEITYTASRALRDHRIVVKVLSPSGNVLFTSTSADHEEGSLSVKPGTYMAKMEFPPRLLSEGSYLVSCYLGQPGVETYDRRENVLSFEVEGFPYRIPERREGCLSFPFSWRWEKVAHDTA